MQWAKALEAAIVAVNKYGGASAGDHTLLDVLILGILFCKKRLTAGDDSSTTFALSYEVALAGAVIHPWAGAESTKDMQAQVLYHLAFALSSGAVKLCVGGYTCNSSRSGAMAATALTVKKVKYEKAS
ncbi:hypothetical protein V6N11_068145 [Hibiscus sabdariffa]|uniref:DhaL domain-containing protein n=1 Tax=Hibiscus sabdariffa TaxID=183260 RepID=A0ABR2SSW0_9ROSI